MDWARLLTDKRLGDREIKQETRNPSRSPYQRDFDRIVFSSSFRRLHDKTQVIPFPESDFVHTRLTHSLEAACVGRSLGNMAGAVILPREEGLDRLFHASDFGDIVASACLAHDIGNPPFGHAGEKAIGEFFNQKEDVKKILAQEDDTDGDKEYQDLIEFEGNANGFRLLTKRGGMGGLQLTCATLGAFTKYPRQSLPQGSNDKVSEKKFGFFQAEKNLFKLIADELGLPKVKGDKWKWKRHPLAFLTEAADDICYHVIDFEDGLRLGLISKEGEDLLREVSRINNGKGKEIRDFRERIGYLRAKAINQLISEAVEVFIGNLDSIVEGSHERALTDDLKNKLAFDKLIEVSYECVYNSRKVVEIEAAGYVVVPGLLNVFVEAIDDQYKKTCQGTRGKSHCEKVLQLLPPQYLDVGGRPHSKAYDRMLNICEFVAGMTDTYAIELYRKLMGISLPK